MGLHGDIVMTQAQIRSRRAKLDKRISDTFRAIKVLQEECTHPNLVTTYHSDTGNYDRSHDSVWKECQCPDCLAWFKIDQRLGYC